MEASSNRNWRMEHWDLLPYSIYGEYVQDVDRWITWKTQYVMEAAIEKLVEMSTQRRVEKDGKEVRFYSYRIRNIDTGEVIPGELFE